MKKETLEKEFKSRVDLNKTNIYNSSSKEFSSDFTYNDEDLDNLENILKELL
jgi:hypothetical protein